jgi:hypothetical protein
MTTAEIQRGNFAGADRSRTAIGGAPPDSRTWITPDLPCWSVTGNDDGKSRMVASRAPISESPQQSRWHEADRNQAAMRSGGEIALQRAGNFHDFSALVGVIIRSAVMAARKRTRAKRASAVGKTVETSVVELKKSVETLRRMLDRYLPSGKRSRSTRTKTRRNVARKSKGTSTRRGRRSKRVT